MVDDRVSKHLKPYPEITFRSSRSLRDTLVHSHHDASITTPVESRKGSRPCHKCQFCRFIYAARGIMLSNGRFFQTQFLCHLPVHWHCLHHSMRMPSILCWKDKAPLFLLNQGPCVPDPKKTNGNPHQPTHRPLS